MSPETNAAIPAATLVLFREGEEAPDLLFVERSRGMAFAGGALVFPGGRVDPGDRALAAELGGDLDDDPEDRAARIAAIRETLEEVGLGIGLPPLAADTLVAMRAALHGGATFGTVLAEHDLRIDPHLLVPFARWRPAHTDMRIFDTRFYLARLPADAPAPSVDGSENVRLLWSSARAVLDLADAGNVHVIFPTRRNLERLARFADFAEAVTNATAFMPRIVTPWTELRGGVQHLCIPDDLGYPVTSEPLASASRR